VKRVGSLACPGRAQPAHMLAHPRASRPACRSRCRRFAAARRKGLGFRPERSYTAGMFVSTGVQRRPPGGFIQPCLPTASDRPGALTMRDSSPFSLLRVGRKPVWRQFAEPHTDG
jgi:hypothetical protein